MQAGDRIERTLLCLSCEDVPSSRVDPAPRNLVVFRDVDNSKGMVFDWWTTLSRRHVANMFAVPYAGGIYRIRGTVGPVDGLGRVTLTRVRVIDYILRKEGQQNG